MKRAVLVAAIAALATGALAAEMSYRLAPQPVAPGTYIFEGTREYFSRGNGGNIVNTGFIVTDAGIVVIDTGPSAAYGRQMRQQIAQLSDQPIVLVVDTHFHPDHFLGNQAFADVPVAASAETAQAIAEQGQSLAENMYRLAGDWMLGTEPMPPHQLIGDETRQIGGHRLRFITLAGHTHSDLMVLDETTKVLFAGDLVFHDRTPTTPHADIATWLAGLEKLDKLDFAVLVPGHGPIARDHRPVAQTADYLRWLSALLEQCAQQGLSMTEVMKRPIPERFQALALARDEFQRSVVHLYPDVEARALPALLQPKSNTAP